MPTAFTYTAIARDGRKTVGTLSADSRSAAIAQVMRDGLHPVSVAEAKGNGKANGKKHALGTLAGAGGAAGAAAEVARPGRVPGKAVEAFTRELANLLAGGVPLARALSLLRREASNPAARFVWNAIHDDVVGGKPLADSLAKWPKAFSSVYVAMVRAGEAGGFLDVVLGQIADFRTREADLKGKVKTALIYPILLAFVATCVVTFLLVYFIPKFSDVFTQFGASLPALTLAIIGLSNIVKSYGIFVAIAIVGGVFFLRRAISTGEGRRKYEMVLLNIPVLGEVIAHFALVRFARMLGTLIGAGVPLVAALKVAREAIGNQILSDTVLHGIEEVQRGQPLSRALGSSEKLFPPSIVETIAVAEETGRLDKELIRMASSFEGDLDRQLRMLVAVAEPLLLVIMAAVIGTIVVGMLLPIFKMQDLIK